MPTIDELMRNESQLISELMAALGGLNLNDAVEGFLNGLPRASRPPRGNKRRRR